MKIQILYFTIFLSCVIHVARTEKAQEIFSLEDVFPDGEVPVKLMTIKMDDVAENLARRMAVSIAENKDWYFEHVKNTEPGEPLKYDPRLGLTEQEYSYFLSEGERRKLVPFAISMINFSKRGDIGYITPDGPESPINSLRINLKTTDLIASVGDVGEATWRFNNDPDLPIGAWEGYKWKYQSGDVYDVRAGNEVSNFSLSIMRLKESGNLLWIMKDWRFHEDQLVQNFSIMFQYPSDGEISNKTVQETGTVPRDDQ